MKRTLSYFFIVIYLLALSINSHAAPKVIPKAPAIAAKSYILMDYNSGKIIAQKNADMPVAPASITKVMTAYVIFAELGEGNIKLSDEVTVSKKPGKHQALVCLLKLIVE